MNETHIDWLTVSFPIPRSLKPQDVLPKHPSFDVIDVDKGIRQYKVSYTLRNTGKLYFDVHKGVEPHILLELTGQPLANMRNDGFSDRALITHIISTGMLNVSRLDYCIDVFGYSAIEHLMQARRDNRTVCKSSHWPRIFDELNPDEGDTLYIGNRKSSDQFIRVYNKKAEQKTDFHWTRIEVVTKGDYAKLLFFDMSQKGVSMAGNDKINSIVKFKGVGWWDYAVKSEGLPTPKTTKESDTQKWLNGAVFSALENEAYKGNIEFLEGYLNKVKQMMLRVESELDVNIRLMDNSNRVG